MGYKLAEQLSIIEHSLLKSYYVELNAYLLFEHALLKSFYVVSTSVAQKARC